MGLIVADDRHQPGNIGGHVVQGVGGIHREAQFVFQQFPPKRGLPPIVKAGRRTGIAIIE